MPSSRARPHSVFAGGTNEPILDVPIGAIRRSACYRSGSVPLRCYMLGERHKVLDVTPVESLSAVRFDQKCRSFPAGSPVVHFGIELVIDPCHRGVAHASDRAGELPQLRAKLRPLGEGNELYGWTPRIGPSSREASCSHPVAHTKSKYSPKVFSQTPWSAFSQTWCMAPVEAVTS